jgi:outer membrane lipoprotein-sorting protein
MLRANKWLFLVLAFGLLLAPFSVCAQQAPPSSSVILSGEEYDQIVAAITQAQADLKKSSETIAQQSKDLATRSMFCAVLASVAATEFVFIVFRK